MYGLSIIQSILYIGDFLKEKMFYDITFEWLNFRNDTHITKKF